MCCDYFCKMSLVRIVSSLAICLFASALAAPGFFDSALLKDIANVSYAENVQPVAVSSIFSPRMDFEQWKPLTGRGDPLRNDPTYDYEPPVLDRVHYWADDPRPDREHRPERKSEVLMLGVSSRKPSLIPRQPPKRHYRPTPIKYEDFTYKLSEHYPMTILVPPPPPPAGHRPALFVLTEETETTPEYATIKSTAKPLPTTPTESPSDPILSSLYALQEANLIYQSSTTSQNWELSAHKNSSVAAHTVTSDYAGWGPTTPMDDPEYINDTHNLIFSDQFEKKKLPYSFYKPMLSEAPPPPQVTVNPLLLPTFLPTALPPITTTTPRLHTSVKQNKFTTEMYVPDMSLNMNEEFVTEEDIFKPTPVPTTQSPYSMKDMLGSMISMPLVNGPERPEDNLYAHASDNIHVYKNTETTTLESMQTMHPPPITKPAETTTILPKTPVLINKNKIPNHNKKANTKILDPYLHLRFTTPKPSEPLDGLVTTTEGSVMPSYLIIQGHSKVKTYSSKTKSPGDKEASSNEIPKPNGTNQVKHLHPITEKPVKKNEKVDTYRSGRAHNLQTLVNEGLGSIEIQEKDIGIKFDVSDGSDVPAEIYKKGFVENEENYSSRKANNTRSKRQLSIEDFLPFDGDQIEEYVYNFFAGRKNSTGITGLLASAVAGDSDNDSDETDER